MTSLREHARARWDGPGRALYGEYDPTTDTRPLLAELRDEVADVPNYTRMIRQRLAVFGGLTWRWRLALAVVDGCQGVAWAALRRFDEPRAPG